jgi:branched-chain amino acid transport system permease protein
MLSPTLGQQLVNGVELGLTYALVAFGYNLSFGVLRVVNLAYGDVLMVSAYAATFASVTLRANALATVICAFLVALALGLSIHIVAVRPLGNVADINSPRHLLVLVSTLGCSLVIQHLVLLAFGGYPVRFPQILPQSFHLAGLYVHGGAPISMVVSLVLLVGLTVLLRSTAIGLRLRAIAENRDLAQTNGVRVDRDELFCVALSSGLAAVAALMAGDFSGAVSPYTGSLYGLKGLIVVIVGGRGNMWGSVLVGLGLGLAEIGAVAFGSSSYRDAVAFCLLLVVIFIRRIFER